MKASIFPSKQLGLRTIVSVASAAILASLAGCGIGAGGDASLPIAALSPHTVSGGVHGGLQPVKNALIQLYEVGATGYGTAAKPILTSTVLTDANGAFNITNLYTCDPGTYVYITASGGNPGGGTNTNLALMAGLGSCSLLKTNAASTFVWINEVTTVASAYALGQFSGGTSFGTTLAALPGSGGVTAPADNFATSATNIQGLANAMAVAAVLANTTTGTSPGSNLNGTASVENYTINTIADVLSTCVNSAGGTAGDNSPCGKVFSATTPTGGVAPVDTIQAALEFALHPGDANLLAGTPSGSTLDALIVPQPPYQPYVNTTITGNSINDWTVAVSYVPVTPNTTTPLLAGSDVVAIDGFGNAWVTSITSKTVVELTPNGDPIQAGAGSGAYSVGSYNVSGTVTPVSGGSDAASKIFGVGLDNSNNAFATDYNGGYIFRIGASGPSIGTSGEIATNANGGGGTAATSLFTGSTGAHPTYVAFDPSDNLYATLYGNGGASPGPAGAVCGAFTTGTKNIVSFFKSAGNYGAIQYGSPAGSNQPMLAIDSGTTDMSGGTAIPGAPFIWWLGEASASGETHGTTSGHYGLLFQAYAGTGGVNPQGCNTPVAAITSAAYTGTATTKIPQNPNGGDATDIFNNAYTIAFDNANNLWTANQLPTDTNATLLTSFTKFTPTYSSPTLAPGVLAGSFSTYATGGLLAPGYKPFMVAIDGGGNVFSSNAGTKPIVAAVTNGGTGLAPATGFTGATYSPDGVNETVRPFSNSVGTAVDLSGNLWVTSGAATPGSAVGITPVIPSVAATNIVQIVGLAVPVQTPIASGVKNNKLGAKP